VQCLSCSVPLAGLALTAHHHLVHPFTDSSHLCLPDHTPPLAVTDRYLLLHHSTCRNQTLSVCTLFHLQESNIVCAQAIPLARIKHCLCVHRSTGRNQTLSVCTLLHLQESNIVCVHAIPLAGIQYCLHAHCPTCQSQGLQNPTHIHCII
jgi:hypothetical protein